MVINKIVDFILNSRYEKLSGNTITTIKRAFIDTIAVTVAAENQSLSLILRQVHKELSFEATDTTFATAIKSDPIEYAFLFGVMSHILDYDDVNFTFYGHPSVTLIPIILALAKENNLTGKEMMEAYSVGFEVQARLGESMGSEQYQTGWHTTSTIGIYGAVAAASKLLRFNGKQIKHVFGIASSFASGTRKNFGTMTKPIHVGLVARNAYLISKMVASGVTGSEDIFSSPLSIDSITTNKMVDFSALKKLGKEWEAEQNGIIFKKYPCCAFTHRSIDAVLDIVNKNEIKLTDVVKMEAFVHYKVPTVLIYDQPKTPTQAQFSMNYCLAAAFVDKEINLSTFSEQNVKRDSVKFLMNKVEMKIDSSQKDPYEKFSKVIIYTENEAYEKIIQFPKGHPKNPLSEDEMLIKFSDCLDVLYDSETKGLLYDCLSNLEDRDYGELERVLLKGGSPHD